MLMDSRAHHRCKMGNSIISLTEVDTDGEVCMWTAPGISLNAWASRTEARPRRGEEREDEDGGAARHRGTHMDLTWRVTRAGSSRARAASGGGGDRRNAQAIWGRRGHPRPHARTSGHSCAVRGRWAGAWDWQTDRCAIGASLRGSEWLS
ncbi:hypothetical protein L227DRAFT_188972 [Lentinus tigrinus ALCF2SS1-6]|uniref:Uncharacterized protein n=1 Tax=Lentinus tigrinus ALCF2SS1-6 TaxID=1328759 RepID=A0A5C2S4L7_9APHY|nr:hypothetical protein L227DRAFT_188972 [Lentinus tigrinus ALCF2SS1-6]